jgi:beta-ureidopropionase / N-carbamoyl-L-amino-acid hydrolase
MIASAVLAARAAATWHDALATCGKVVAAPNGVNAIPSRVTAWLDPTGISHPPAENAERDDCLTGVEALTAVAAELAGPEPTP